MHRIAIGSVVAVVLIVGCGERSGPRLNGTGSTFVHPIMVRWTEEYRKAKGGQVTYESVGSAVGMQRLPSGLFDFACIDAPPDDTQLAAITKEGGDVAYVPLLLGAVVPAYNLPGFKDPLTFSGPVLADVFLGKITRWNDKALQELNTGVTLPDAPIVVVHRSEGSGTTYVWTDFLSKTSPEWKEKVGFAGSVKWPAGIGTPGHSGVANAIKSNVGALGYLHLDFALRSKVGVGLMKNRSGTAVKADLASVAVAARSSLAEIPPDLRFSLTDAGGTDAYPISGIVWAIVHVKQPADKAKALADFLRWATHEGQELAEGLNYAPLPAELVERIDKLLDKLAGKS